MTVEQVKALTNDELNIKVAELCGGVWLRLEPLSDNKRSLVLPQGADNIAFVSRLPKADGTEEVCQIHQLPRFTGDFNAMHEAVRKQDERKGENFTLEFMSNVVTVSVGTRPVGQWNWHDMWSYAMATARQLAEAFVLTMEEE